MNSWNLLNLVIGGIYKQQGICLNILSPDQKHKDSHAKQYRKIVDPQISNSYQRKILIGTNLSINTIYLGKFVIKVERIWIKKLIQVCVAMLNCHQKTKMPKIKKLNQTQL